MYYKIKRFFDIIISLFAIVFTLWLFILIPAAIVLEDGYPVIYKHTRIGLCNKNIKIYKFRSMKNTNGKLEDVLNEQQLLQYRNEFKIENDPRVTKVGSFIRKTSLDELPQLINVLEGTMSLVGPRPIIEEELKKYYNFEQQERLLSVRPGLTGYWQAYARNDATYVSGDRQRMEMHYIENQSLLFDLKILLKTFVTVLRKSGVK